MYKKAFLFLIFSAISPYASGAPFAVGNIVAHPGQQTSGNLVVPEGIDAGTVIPITVTHGAADGPTLVLIAGTHGYEYPGITALQRIRKHIDPQELSGTVIMVHIANVPSFLRRTIYFNPVDGKNLNREYPGDSAGTQSQRIADIITSMIIEKADYLIDLHAGDGNESLRPYVYMPETGEAKLDAAIKGLALAFGLDHIVIDRSPLSTLEDSSFTDMTALVRAIPAITTETGQMGLNGDYWVDMAEAGVWNVLRHLKMISGEEEINEGVTWLTDYQVITSPQDGIFQAAVRDGYMVSKGAKLGVLVDFFGDEIQVIKAPFSGVVNYVIGTPPVGKGEPVAMISKVQP